MFNFEAHVQKEEEGHAWNCRAFNTKTLEKNDRFSWPSLWLKNCISVLEQGDLSKIFCRISDFIHYHKGIKV